MKTAGKFQFAFGFVLFTRETERESEYELIILYSIITTHNIIMYNKNNKKKNIDSLTHYNLAFLFRCQSHDDRHNIIIFAVGDDYN